MHRFPVNNARAAQQTLMAQNPLFPSNSSDPAIPVDPARPVPQPASAQPAQQPQPAETHPLQYRPELEQPAAKSDDAAADLIRRKIEQLYGDSAPVAQPSRQSNDEHQEPSVRAELTEVEEVSREHVQRSRHQQYMYELSNSGKSLAEIQTAWHEYYRNLPDSEKHQVWQEFYSTNARTDQQLGSHRDTSAIYPTATAFEAPKPRSTSQYEPAKPQEHTTPTVSSQPFGQPLTDLSSPAKTAPLDAAPASKRKSNDIKRQLLDTVSSRGKLTPKHHLHSLLFGLGFGGLTLFVVLFGFFNEVVIAPFVQPSREVSATPIIVGADGKASSDKDEIVIPKINLEIPLDFSVTSTNEAEVETALENGIVHYPTTSLPGQQGNTAFFGHSSNNIFNPGKYKFAFVLLHELVTGDKFYLTKGGVTYVYEVYDKKIVKPNEVGVLNAVEGKTATATLITCDPPGTSINRLVVWGQQVSPDPNGNAAAAAPAGANAATGDQSQDKALPGNGPTLWGRFINWITNKD